MRRLQSRSGSPSSDLIWSGAFSVSTTGVLYVPVRRAALDAIRMVRSRRANAGNRRSPRQLQDARPFTGREATGIYRGQPERHLDPRPGAPKTLKVHIRTLARASPAWISRWDARIIYRSTQDGGSVFEKNASGAGTEQLLLKATDQRPVSGLSGRQVPAVFCNPVRTVGTRYFCVASDR